MEELRGDMENDLFTEVVEATNLPKDLISEELVSIISKSDFDPNSLSIEQLRAAMLIYLDEVMGPHLTNTDA